MNGKEYIERVMAALRRAKPGEREDIARELEAHLEDHRAALMDLGWTEEEADHRAAETMGDPEETAKALDAQFSQFWGFMEDLAKMFAITLWIVVMVLNQYYYPPSFWETNLDAFCRYYPPEAPKEDFDYQKVSVRVNTGYDHLWAYGVVISPTKKQAQVYYSLCDLNPFGYVSEEIYWESEPLWDGAPINPGADHFWVKTPGGEWQLYYDCRYDPDDKYARGVVGYIPVEEDQDHIDLRYDRLGDVVEFQVPIDKEVWE